MTDLLDELFDIGNDDIVDSSDGNIIKAPFGWVGGKSESVKYLLPIFKRYLTTKWVDVFGGCGIVSWNMPPCRLMVYNDAYSGVVDFYRCLQNEALCVRLIEFVDTLMPPQSREQWVNARAEWCTESDPVARAAKWFYMLKLSVINKGKCYGRATNSRSQLSIPNVKEHFREVHDRLKRFQIENLDYERCLLDYDSSDALFYCDPPYVGKSAGVYEVRFGRPEYDKLLDLISHLKGTVCLSGYDNEMANSRPYWTDKHRWKVALNAEVQAFTDGNNKADKANVQTVGHAEEVLWVKEAY